MVESLYIHIPFCRRKCLYCDFYSVIYDEKIAQAYVDTLVKQIETLDSKFSTVYIGGGTPSALSVGQLNKLFSNLAKYRAAECEFTIEANPESLSDDKIAAIRDGGVNRMSIGIQSLKDYKLRKLGRLHTAEQAKDAVRRVSKKGIENIGVDLIFGFWDEGIDDWERDLEEAVKLPIQHISCYGLTYEKNTPLFNALKNKSLEPLDDVEIAGMYECAIDRLERSGFQQYEVSNFAKEGYACKHNLSYWDNNSYIGVGASAVSYLDGVRSNNVADIKDYIRRVNEDKSFISSIEKLSPLKRAKETAALKIRTKNGIDFDWFKDKTGYSFLELEQKAVSKLIEDGLLKYKKKHNIPSGVFVKRKGFLFCDTVSSAFL